VCSILTLVYKSVGKYVRSTILFVSYVLDSRLMSSEISYASRLPTIQSLSGYEVQDGSAILKNIGT
jgi:hypothetical protein